MVKCFVHLAYSNGCCSSFVKFLMEKEVETCQLSSLLFRGDSLASAVFSYYSRMVACHYLFKVLARTIQELDFVSKEAQKQTKQANTSLFAVQLEVDPGRLSNEEREDFDIDINAASLVLTCQKVYSAIAKNIDSIPIELKDLLSFVSQLVEKKFAAPDATRVAVSNLFFLRFLCPTIVCPSICGILPEPPDKNLQRQLMLICKVIQAIASGTIPGTRESYLDTITPWVAKTIPKMQALLSKLHAGRASQGREIQIPEPVRINNLVWILNRIKDPAKYSSLHKLLSECEDLSELLIALEAIQTAYSKKTRQKVPKDRKA
ncbi:probable Ras GTPase-activating-like protein ngap [Schistocerca gregaria]|uniref:probable Ras GTPase-activating-like protein ngap n=1 Tax=Schistocerca gregaria TaxID=7010 RepID=UPI00211E3C11|nr:probable Ras GTPase-activating-like protein ngap [Schistocerca gregaria]